MKFITITLLILCVNIILSQNATNYIGKTRLGDHQGPEGSIVTVTNLISSTHTYSAITNGGGTFFIENIVAATSGISESSSQQPILNYSWNNFSTNLDIKDVQLFDITGAQIKDKNIIKLTKSENGTHIWFDGTLLSNGTYFTRMVDINDNFYDRKFVSFKKGTPHLPNFNFSQKFSSRETNNLKGKLDPYTAPAGTIVPFEFIFEASDGQFETFIDTFNLTIPSEPENIVNEHHLPPLPQQKTAKFKIVNGLDYPVDGIVRGEGISGIVATLFNAEGEQLAQAVSDGDGYVKFTGVPCGEQFVGDGCYQMKIDGGSFSDLIVSNLNFGERETVSDSLYLSRLTHHDGYPGPIDETRIALFSYADQFKARDSNGELMEPLEGLTRNRALEGRLSLDYSQIVYGDGQITEFVQGFKERIYNINQYQENAYRNLFLGELRGIPEEERDNYYEIVSSPRVAVETQDFDFWTEYPQAGTNWGTDGNNTQHVVNPQEEVNGGVSYGSVKATINNSAEGYTTVHECGWRFNYGVGGVSVFAGSGTTMTNEDIYGTQLSDDMQSSIHNASLGIFNAVTLWDYWQDPDQLQVKYMLHLKSSVNVTEEIEKSR